MDKKQKSKLKDVLQYVAYTAAIDLVECDGPNWHHMFPRCDLITRKTIEECYPKLLERELKDGIHGEGFYDKTICIPICKPEPYQIPRQRLEEIATKFKDAFFITFDNKIEAFEYIQEDLDLTPEECEWLGVEIPDEYDEDEDWM